ncbi:MAG: pyruvate, phosphate dikinase [Betaproteobacteria bacterium]|nr:pyruvate, phosphate dikinase [Betaproteobacteria bacterium]
MTATDIPAPWPVPLVTAIDGTCRLSRDDIGGKAWGVNRMRELGLPVPPAFVVTTHACRDYFSSNRILSDGLWGRIVSHVRRLEDGTDRRFGGARRPLLLSVRSGAAHSMPGMMDTILDLGLNATAESALTAETGDGQFAADTRQRFVQLYRRVVLGSRLEAVPEDPWAQLRAAVAAVFDSWHSPRARAYRRNRGLSEDAGTAVTIQAMVFGNLDDRSGTGVLFSRNPITGDALPWGEWLPRAQGEDVVSGETTPDTLERLADAMPDVHRELLQAARVLETDAKDVQDIEYTVEAGRLWLLQCRVAKRSPQASVRLAIAFVDEGLISEDEALGRLDAEQMRSLPRLALRPECEDRLPDARGEPASPGLARGTVVTEAAMAEVCAHRGVDVILARPTTSPEDLHGVIAARGLVTEQGGSTSHAAVVSRELGRPCVVGCGSGTVMGLAGHLVTMDGTTGRVWRGDLTVDCMREEANDDLRRLIRWALARTTVRVLETDAAPADAVDLDAFGDHWREALGPGIAVRGQVLETEAGIQASVHAGVGAVVVRARLPAALSCLHAVAMAEAQDESGAAGPADFTDGLADLVLLRAAALKGRASTAILADALSLPEPVVDKDYRALAQRGLCQLGAGVRLTAAGRAELERLLALERQGVDASHLTALYSAFADHNDEFKRIMTGWQLKADGAVNDHADAAYDTAILERLASLHRRFAPFLEQATAAVPRLALYRDRLERAATRISGGDTSFVARIIADSYHTVWFEFHEELLALAGLKRRDLGAAVA